MLWKHGGFECGLKLLEKTLAEMKLVLVSEDVSRISNKSGDAEAILSWNEDIQKAMRQE